MGASIAAHESWAKTHNRSERTAPARAAMANRFLKEADGDPQRAASLKKAYYQRLALKSAQARRRGREASELAASVDAELANLNGEVS